jgi:ketosteroid isomerase-like protein
MTSEYDGDEFKALEPFFRIILEGLDDMVDGERFFDILAEDVVTEFVATVPGYPQRVEGRESLAALYRGYGDAIILDHSGDLAVHRDRESSTVVLEYAVQGHLTVTGAPYRNRFVSVITIRDREVTHWRDYLDSYAAVQALGADRFRTGGALGGGAV